MQAPVHAPSTLPAGGSFRTFILIVLFCLAGRAAYAQAQCQTIQVLPPAVVGTPYSTLLGPSGGTPPYHGFQLTGSLPPGLSMIVGSSSYSGVQDITGTPTSAIGSPFVFDVNFEDANNNPAAYCPFSITVTGAAGPPTLNVVPSILNFTGEANSSTPLVASFLVQNTGSGSISFTATPGSSSWIKSVSPTSGTVTATTPQVVTVTVSTQGQKGATSLVDAIHFTSSSGNASPAVTLFNTNTGGIMGVGLAGVRFNMVQGAGSSVMQTVNITDEGDPTSSVNWIATPVSAPGVPNGDFLSLTTPASQSDQSQSQACQSGQSSSSGQSSFARAQAGSSQTTASCQSLPGTPVGLTFSLNSNASTLAVGTYWELVQVTDPNSQNSPQYITAVLDVTSPKAGPLPPEPYPAGLVFSGPVGQPIPSQQVTVNLSAAQFNTFLADASAPPGQNWLNVTPASGSASTATPQVLTVSVNTSKLGAGVYNGTVDITTIVGGSVGILSVNVTMILASPFSGSAVRAATPATPTTPAAAVSGCTPTQLVLTETGLPNNFAVPAGWPSNLITTLNDDCGNAISGGAVTASFSNGDPPLTLADQGVAGQYAATWQPSNLATTIVTLNGTRGALKPVTSQISGFVEQNQSPVLAPNGILNNFTFLRGGAMAPGMVAAAFGSGLSTYTGGTGTVPLPTAFQNTQLIVAGLLTPLDYLSPGQLDVQIPLELTPGQQYATVAVVNNQLSLPISIPVVATAPAVLAASDGSLIAQHNKDGSLVSAASPAQPGEVLVMYLVGMGITTPAVKSGVVSPGLNPGDVLANALIQPVVQVGTQPAQVLFAGLTPGFVGLYQIDFVVPASASTGTSNVTVTQGSTAANTTTLLVGP